MRKIWMQVFLTTIFFMFITVSLAQADILNVPDDFEIIQAGIDAADDGDTVLVAPGVYEENITTAGKSNITIGSLTLTTDDPAFIEETIIDGGGNDVVVRLRDMQRNGHVLLRGFTIRNGNSDLAGGIEATGAIYAEMLDIVVTGNQGGMAAGIAATSIWDAHFRNVRAIENDGTGVYISATRTSFENCEFSSNAGTGGNIGAGSLLMRNASFLDNVNTGLNIWVTRHILLDHVSIAGTRQQNGENGNGLRIYQQSCSNFTAELTNSIIFSNQGGSIVLREGPDNSVGTLSVSYSDIEGGLDEIVIEEGGDPEISWLDGNIDEDPLFVNADNDDYHLTEDSPCIDAGDPESDPDPDGTRADMGAYYFIFPEDDDGVLHVPDEYETIQAAIDFAVESNTIIVEPGVYEENLNFLGKGISLIGDPDNPEEVIIDGGANDASVVVFRNDEGEETSMSGFTIRNGDTDYGGGIYCNETSPTLSNLVIIGNHAVHLGGGIYCTAESAPTLSNSVIRENTALRGGGFSCYNESRAVLTNVVITGNSTWGDAGGVQCSSSEMLLRRCVVAHNEANDAGGGLIAIGQSNRLILENSLVFGNTSNVGAGIFKNQGELYVINSIIRDQTGETFDGLTEDDTIKFSNIEGGYEGDGNIDEDPLFVDSENGDYHLTEDSPCIDAGDPESDLDPDGTRADIGAYYLHQRDIDLDCDELVFEPVELGDEDSLSVTITNTGNTLLTFNMMRMRDPESGHFILRHEGEDLELGAQEEFVAWVIFHPLEEGRHETQFRITSNDPDEEFVSIGLIGDAAQGLRDHQENIPIAFAIQVIYPNPFNSTTTIGYSLPATGAVSLIVYDLSGREVARLADGVKPAGTHEAVWVADGVASGVYVVKLVTGKKTLMSKMVLVR